MNKILIIDPPSGWLYGFPKPFTNPNNLSINNWLLINGYPQYEIDKFKSMNVPCRFWEKEI